MSHQPNHLFSLKDRVIVVTGAGGVLAGATAKYLISQGANIVLLDLHQEKLDATIAACGNGGSQTLGLTCDVLDQDALQNASNTVLERFGCVDALINGAGGNMPGATVAPDQSIFDIDVNDYRRVLDLNLMGSILPSIAFAKTFSKQGSGCIINFSSMTATQAITRVPGYSNAKAAIDNFTKWMAVELSQKFGDGVRVNAIAPGFFIGDQNRHLLINEDGSFTPRGKQVINKTPFGRFGEADEVFGTIHYLLRDAASFVTGTVIPVDGGFSCFSGV